MPPHAAVPGKLLKDISQQLRDKQKPQKGNTGDLGTCGRLGVKGSPHDCTFNWARPLNGRFAT